MEHVAEWLPTALLILATVGNGIVMLDNFIHRRDRKLASLEYQTSGKASLQAQLTELADDLEQSKAAARTVIADMRAGFTEQLSQFESRMRRGYEAAESLRLERAGILAKEMAGLHESIDQLHRKASENGTQLQAQANGFGSRLIRLEERLRAIRPRHAGEHDDA